MIRHRILAGFALLLLFTGCSKKIFVSDSDLTVVPFEYQYFSAKAKIKYEDGKNDFDATANIRMQRDSVVWISITPGMGVEAARLKVMPDSVIFLDRINKKYFTSNFKKLGEKYEFDFNFKMLESILVGNLIYPYSKEELVKTSEGVSYIQNQDEVVFDNFIGDKTRKLERLSVTDIETNSTISVNYSDFGLVGEEVFPFLIVAAMEYYSKEKKKTDVEIKFNKVQVEEKALKFPINVPSKYIAM